MSVWGDMRVNARYDLHEGLGLHEAYINAKGYMGFTCLCHACLGLHECHVSVTRRCWLKCVLHVCYMLYTCCMMAEAYIRIHM